MKFDLQSKYKPQGDQPQAIQSLVEGINDGLSAQVLKGVTGSGKTSIFLKLVDHTISSGKSAIVMVPEISLTPQTVNRFVSRFGEEKVANFFFQYILNPMKVIDTEYINIGFSDKDDQILITSEPVADFLHIFISSKN